MISTIKRWATAVPDGFKFTFKLFREVTHVNNLEFDPAHIAKFMETIAHIGEKKGCVLVQLPPGLDSTHVEQLGRILEAIRQADRERLWKVAVEFRNKGWYNDETREVLRAHNATMVLHDIQKSAPALVSDESTDFVYVRFHGPTGNYRGSYSEAFLKEYAEYVNEWITDGKTVYLYFNNTAGDAFNNARLLNKYVL